MSDSFRQTCEKSLFPFIWIHSFVSLIETRFTGFSINCKTMISARKFGGILLKQSLRPSGLNRIIAASSLMKSPFSTKPSSLSIMKTRNIGISAHIDSGKYFIAAYGFELEHLMTLL